MCYGTHVMSPSFKVLRRTIISLYGNITTGTRGSLAGSPAAHFPKLPLISPLHLSTYHFSIDRLPKLRCVASSCFISLSHGTPAVFLSAYALLTDPDRGFGSRNTAVQNGVLDYSIAYFVMDLVHYLIFNPSEVLFIGHHLATLFVFVTCRYVVSRGAYAVLVLLILAEVTSLCQNVWTLSVALRAESVKAAKVYEFLSPPFYAFYSIVRGLAGPWFVYEMGVFYAAGVGEHVIPKWIWVSWLVVVVSALCVSILWIANLWVELFRERSAKLEKKVE
uniref:TLC domain-containing protein n=1 Tax=Kalanchoe fedtschenkoi TaxID=63787 RepID=A0A7N0ZSD9_KALFE